MGEGINSESCENNVTRIKKRYFVFEEKMADRVQSRSEPFQISHLWLISPMDDDSVLEKIAKQKRARKGNSCSGLSATRCKALFSVDNFWV